MGTTLSHLVRHSPHGVFTLTAAVYAVQNSETLRFARAGVGGVVHTWDMRTRQCVSRFVDEGALRGGALASSTGLRYLASGSDAGFVNVYDHKAALRVRTRPPPHPWCIVYCDAAAG